MPLTCYEQKIALYDLCKAFVDRYNITCAEATVEDRVYENAPDLVLEICDIIGYKEYENDDV